MFQITIQSRDYLKWKVTTISNEKEKEENIFLDDFEPMKHYLFHGDIFSLSTISSISRKSTIKIEQPSILRESYFPAILLLTKTYGSVKGTKKMYYKCIPNDIHYPCFLVPYELSMKSFHKKISNMYVLLRLKEWGSTNHPIAVIDRIIGSVGITEHLYEYEIFCKKLENTTMRQFSKEVSLFSSSELIIENVEKEYIFSIDPEGCIDYDDAFSISQEENTDIIKLCIYISNVPYGLDKMNVWKYIKQVSTIYLPHKKKTMLPNILSDDKYSLQSKTWKQVFVMELMITNQGEEVSVHFYQRLAKIAENFIYDEPALLLHPKYKLLEKTVQILSKNEKYGYIKNINNSHDVVAYLMIFMNHQVGSRLQRGIFRCTEESLSIRDNIPDSIKNDIIGWSSSEVGVYIGYYRPPQYNNENNLKTQPPIHRALDLSYYTHITSPIRRLVDIINMILFQQQYNIYSFSTSANDFVDSWMNRVSYINEQTLYIKQLQNKCNLFYFLQNVSTIEGIILEKNNINQLVTLYITSIRRIFVTKLLADVLLFKTYHFNVHLFEDESSMKTKIRLSLTSPNSVSR